MKNQYTPVGKVTYPCVMRYVTLIASYLTMTVYADIIEKASLGQQ